VFKNLPLQEIIDTFHYIDGNLFWRIPKKGRQLHKPITCKNTRGYVIVSLHGRVWPIHRFVWSLHNGDIPDGLEIDHKNRIKHDNRIENLRLLTRSKNLHNATAKRGNVGGCVGVNWVKSKRYWQATICVDYKHKYIGSSSDYFQACCLRKSEEVKAHRKMGL